MDEFGRQLSMIAVLSAVVASLAVAAALQDHWF
jgi:hypothetical protein